MGRHSAYKTKKILASKESLKRTTPKRKPNQRILIVTEGEETERRYFNSFISALNLRAVDVDISGKECGSAPTSVVKFAEKKARIERDYEAVFCVFDRDTHDDYEAAKSQVLRLQKNTKFPAKIIRSIVSIPCIELWFILHFKYHRKPYHRTGKKSPCHNLISELKKIEGFDVYEKAISSEQLNILLPKTNEAIKNSKLSLKEAKNDGEENPSTLMHEIIEYLRKAKQEAVAEAQKSK